MVTTHETNANRQVIEEDEIDLLDLGARVWAGKVVILCITLVAAFIGVVVALNTPPTFQADGLLQLEEKSNQLALPQSIADLSAESPRAATEIEIIRSRLVVGRAVSRLNLDWRAEPLYAPLLGHLLATRDLPLPAYEFLRPFARPGDAIALDLLEVPPRWLGQKLILTSGGDGSFTIAFPDGQRASGQVGETFIDAETGFSLRVGSLRGAEGRQFQLSQLDEVTAIARVRGRLGVSEQGRNSGILRITYEDRSPETARRTLDAIAQAYLAQNAERSAAEAESSLTFVQEQLPDAREALAEAEAALDAFRQQQDAINLSAEGEALLTQIRALEAEQFELEALEEEIAQRYTQNHPEYQRLLGNRERLTEQLTALREEVRTLPAAQREVLNLTQDLELVREVFVQLRNRAQELEVLRASNIGNVRIVDTARVNQQPISPRRSRILALAILLGGVLAVGIVLVRGYLRKSIIGAEQIEAIGLPVFATLNRSTSTPAQFRGRRARHLPARDAPDEVFVEGLRSLRTSLHFAMLDAKSKSIAVTSAAPGAGKSFLSANLAVAAATSDQKICLIDADMRRGEVRKYFDIGRERPGLAQILSGDVPFRDALIATKISGLSVIPSGPFPPNPSELLMRKEFDELIKALDAEFDLILIDTPPVLAVTDPVIIASKAGATIAVARFDETLPGEIQAMVKALDASGVRFAGAVLNAFDPRKAKKAGASTYAYNYRYSYGSRS